MKDIFTDSYNAAKELIERSKIKSGQILLVGCSSSEIDGSCLGTASNADNGKIVCEAILKACREHGLYLAGQCCEHLNRAIIIEEAAMEKYKLTQVNCVPQLKAGGSFATALYQSLESPVAVADIRAHAGLDIGGVLIGMHLKEIAVPMRLSTKTIGNALVIAARTRPPFTGGSRAQYDENLM